MPDGSSAGQAPTTPRGRNTPRPCARRRPSLPGRGPAIEAERASRNRPSAQLFTVKGLAEANLGLWREAEASFLRAFRLGFDKAEAWAADAALAGLAASFEELGLEAAALRHLRPARRQVGVQAGPDVRGRAADEPRPGRSGKASSPRSANGPWPRCLKTLDRLCDRDFACGLFHYLHAQVDVHLDDSGPRLRGGRHGPRAGPADREDRA
ncbi:MAG: hypothetical protein MZV65_53295 [Chromatiales bacterium]|nr:hypothetical protein [Chromatiales bacterium]